MLNFFLISFFVVMGVVGFCAFWGIIIAIGNGGADFVKVADLEYFVAEMEKNRGK